mmetsp:Transcript_2711/g.10878  ORF Transcript_2711/g.10878 Transcript_2711/m.10878 type:complete len:241 (+) Transcript_2711:240-962(+)
MVPCDKPRDCAQRLPVLPRQRGSHQCVHPAGLYSALPVLPVPAAGQRVLFARLHPPDHRHNQHHGRGADLGRPADGCDWLRRHPHRHRGLAPARCGRQGEQPHGDPPWAFGVGRHCVPGRARRRSREDSQRRGRARRLRSPVRQAREPRRRPCGVLRENGPAGRRVELEAQAHSRGRGQDALQPLATAQVPGNGRVRSPGRRLSSLPRQHRHADAARCGLSRWGGRRCPCQPRGRRPLAS